MTIHRPPRPPVTVQPGNLYGPGTSRRTPVGRMVWSALRSHPVVLDTDPEAPLHPLHVKDLVSALSAVLQDPSGAGGFTLAGEKPSTARDLAETVSRVVRPVPVELSPTPSASPSTPLVPALPPGWHPTVDLDYGLHSFAQWLAYEAIHLPEADQ
ncbi:hypothetical protein AB0F71_25265 [Kitasatospora sp. NPDC028055]|uniref:NAD-dependent epimerase/dehydratase family protein n=1 Tax=Kitasatospora sp. NPDC028055 TaxID=3155653 RepID=UPI0033CFED88